MRRPDHRGMLTASVVARSLSRASISAHIPIYLDGLRTGCRDSDGPFVDTRGMDHGNSVVFPQDVPVIFLPSADLAGQTPTCDVVAEYLWNSQGLGEHSWGNWIEVTY